MSRRSWLPLAVVLLVMACSAVGWAGDEVRDGAKFNNPATGRVIFVKRWVDSTDTSTGVVAGRIDSAVIVFPAKVLPLPLTIGGVVRADTSSKTLTLTSAGSLINDDASRDRDFKIWTTPVSDTVSTWTPDSTVSGPFYTAQMARMWLRVQVTWPNAVHDSLGQRQKYCTFAVQIRAHLTSQTDSLNTNPWYVYADSSHTNSLSVTALAGTTPGAGQGYRMSTLTGVGANTALAQTLPLPSEYVFEAYRAPFGTGAAGANYYGEPTNFWIPLADVRGVYFWAPYTSIRIRTLTNYLVNIDAQPKYVVDLVGTAR